MSERQRALLRRVIGFTVGFAAALTIIVASEMGKDTETGASRVIGELDVFEHCRDGEFELEAALREHDAFGWRCVGRRNGIWGFDEPDFDAACRQQYGGGAWAFTDDPASPYEWRCAVDE